jgi:large conductance mechanosensitive channel
MGLMGDFKNFAMKGNVLMPPLGLLLGKVDFKDLKLIIRHGADGAANVTLNYGMFVQNIFDFLIIAFCIFMLIRAYQKMEKKKVEAPAPPAAASKQEQLLEEIRDLLKK